MRKNKNGNAVQLDSESGTISFAATNPDFTIENVNGNLYINAKKVFINGKEFK